MTHTKCLSCNGVYDNTLTDGMQYFHVCPASVAQPNRRNENIVSTQASDTGKAISAGTGTQVV